MTLDNKELRREKRETRDWRILPVGYPKLKWVQAVFGLGTQEEGVWGRTRPILASRHSGAERHPWGAGGNGGGVEEARLLLALLVYQPPDRAGIEDKSLLTAREATN